MTVANTFSSVYRPSLVLESFGSRRRRATPRTSTRAATHITASSSDYNENFENFINSGRALDCWRSSLPSTSILDEPSQNWLPQLRRPSGHCPAPGKVYLVGTGPGDPGLLTLRALQLMQTADVVLYDRLVSPEILDLIHGGARMVYVGKQKGMHTRTQEEIHDLLHQWASDVPVVLRLKGGDPFIFGRGGEEAEYLRQRGVQVQCIPGITAAAGICAELGIPMTHRGVATSVRFLTGHVREGSQSDLDETLAVCNDPHTTLVVYMGLNSLPSLASRLLSLGMPPTTAAVAVERGTTAEQRVVYAPISRLAGDVDHAELKSPTLIIIGDVVACSPGWQTVTESDSHKGLGMPFSFPRDNSLGHVKVDSSKLSEVQGHLGY
eukprot:jgi/Botrbrau1/15320/Bobra.0319s0006.1